MKKLTLVRWLTLFTVGASLLGPLPAARAQTPIPASKIQAVLDTMTPEERVGQLFLVTFSGTDTSAESQIRDLISNYHVGGVVLQAGNDNFVAEPDTVTGAHQLINALQGMEWEATVSSSPPDQNTYVPLFMGISQEGDGAPNDQVLNGLTALPNEMAIGATWNTPADDYRDLFVACVNNNSETVDLLMECTVRRVVIDNAYDRCGRELRNLATGCNANTEIDEEETY